MIVIFAVVSAAPTIAMVFVRRRRLCSGGAIITLICLRGAQYPAVPRSILYLARRFAQVAGMKSIFSPGFFAAVFAALSLTGCLQVERIVHLKTDGSGTIEEKLTMSAATVAQMKQMQAFGQPGGGKAEPFKLLDEEKLKAAAEQMGEGVKFVSAKPISGPEGEGYVATYSFADISKVKLSQGPADLAPGGGGMKIKSSDDKPIKFTFAKGSPATLTVMLPEEKKADPADPAKPSEPDPAEAMQEAMLPMITQMMKDMHMKVAIDIEGTITKTNAEYRDGEQVTLMDVDFNALIANPDKMKAMMKKENQSPRASKELLKGIEGIKVEGNNPVTISFK